MPTPILMIRVSVISVCISAIASYSNAFADTVYLKNGRSLEGIVVSSSPTLIELEVSGGTVAFSPQEIERIESHSDDKRQELRTQWELEQRKNRQEEYKRKTQEASKPKHSEFVNEHGGLTVVAQINESADAKLILDTGASVVVLRKQIAQQLGIDVDAIKDEIKTIVADGRQVNAKFLILEKIKVNDAVAHNVDAAVLPDEAAKFGSADGLLGMSFLKQFNFKIDQEKHQLILEKLSE